MDPTEIINMRTQKGWSTIGDVFNGTIRNKTHETFPKIIQKTNGVIFERIACDQKITKNYKYNTMIKEHKWSQGLKQSEFVTHEKEMMEFILLTTLYRSNHTIYLIIQYNHKTCKTRLLAYEIHESQVPYEDYKHNSMSKQNTIECLSNFFEICLNEKLLAGTLSMSSGALDKLSKRDYSYFL